MENLSVPLILVSKLRLSLKQPPKALLLRQCCQFKLRQPPLLRVPSKFTSWNWSLNAKALYLEQQPWHRWEDFFNPSPNSSRKIWSDWTYALILLWCTISSIMYWLNFYSWLHLKQPPRPLSSHLRSLHKQT